MAISHWQEIVEHVAENHGGILPDTLKRYVREVTGKPSAAALTDEDVAKVKGKLAEWERDISF